MLCLLLKRLFNPAADGAAAARRQMVYQTEYDGFTKISASRRRDNVPISVAMLAHRFRLPTMPPPKN